MNIGVQGIDIVGIERDLRELWKQMSESSVQESQQAVTRACVLNLMVYAPGEQSEATIGLIMAEVTHENPGRIIVMLANLQATVPYLDAWVTAQCHLSSGGRKQICCEQIMIRADGESVLKLPSIAMPLLVPDVPVFLWWHNETPEGSELFRELVDTSDRVILDSASASDPQEGFKRIAVAITESEWTAFTDLNWARLTPWRLSLADFFDVAETRSHLNKINQVEVECSEDTFAQALLLFGWLGSCLQWKPATRLRKGSFDVQSAQRKISFRIETRQKGFRSISLSTPDAKFCVSLSEADRHLESAVELNGRKSAGRVQAWLEDNEAELIGRELEILGHDRTYEMAIRFLSEIWNA